MQLLHDARMDLVIDPVKEELVLLADLGKRLRLQIPYITAFSWYKRGILNRHTHERIKLECIRIPAGLATSVEAFRRFILKLNAPN